MITMKDVTVDNFYIDEIVRETEKLLDRLIPQYLLYTSDGRLHSVKEQGFFIDIRALELNIKHPTNYFSIITKRNLSDNEIKILLNKLQTLTYRYRKEGFKVISEMTFMYRKERYRPDEKGVYTRIYFKDIYLPRKND